MPKLPEFNATAYNRSGGFCLVALDDQNRILCSTALSAGTWDGTPRYDDWFRARYKIILTVRDEGQGYVQRTRRAG